MDAVKLLFSPSGKSVDEIRAELWVIAKREPPRDDTELVESVLKVTSKHGKLVSRRMIWSNGSGHEPSTWTLIQTGPASSFNSGDRC